MIVEDLVSRNVGTAGVHAGLLQQAGRVQLLAVTQTLSEFGVQNADN
jgi:hypothetical protein